MNWSPYMIDIVLHHHCGRSEYPNRHAPAFVPAMESLVDMGVLYRDKEGFVTTTELGVALVSMWCSTPLPVMKWVDPRFKSEDGNSVLDN